MTSSLEHYYALIMAGGGGTRLWPLSRQSQPKQMLRLIGPDTMYQMTIRRLYPLLAPDHIYVITGQDQVESLQAQTPEIPAQNFIIEPFGKNSGPAAGLGTLVIHQRDPQALIATLSADHYVADTEQFRKVLVSAHELASEGLFATLGITASRPAVQFGYIKRGESLGTRNDLECFKAVSFTEKPDLERAREFVRSGLYSWNSGMFIWAADAVLAEFERQQPAIHRLLLEIDQHIGAPDFTARITPLWQKMPNISLDYAIMEDAPEIAVIPVDIGWSDIGSWDMLLDLLEGDAAGNVLLSESTQEPILIDTRRTLVASDRLIVTIGVEDMIVVETDDVILVCHRNRSQDVREVVRRLRERGADAYL
jgi:mannose-1-phosphate guanylyltransferase